MSKEIRYVIVDAVQKLARVEEYAEFKDAVCAAGLNPGETDHGLLQPGLGYVVYEYGLFEPVEQQHYWRFGSLLIAGNALLYAIDGLGETVDVILDAKIRRQILFFNSAADVERAIDRGLVQRPRMAIDQEVLWRWPEPKPRWWGWGSV
jgi:hypothetical protein